MMMVCQKGGAAYMSVRGRGSEISWPTLWIPGQLQPSRSLGWSLVCPWLPYSEPPRSLCSGGPRPVVSQSCQCKTFRLSGNQEVAPPPGSRLPKIIVRTHHVSLRAWTGLALLVDPSLSLSLSDLSTLSIPLSLQLSRRHANDLQQ